MVDIYSQSSNHKSHSLRYIHIIAKNVVGILNRIASLMRRKRYNMEEVSVSFDDQNLAHMIIAVDGNLIDIELVIHQINKLHDVFEVYDATHLQDKLFNGVYVQVSNRNDFKKFPIQPLNITEEKNITGVMVEKVITGVFMIKLEEAAEFYNFLNKRKYKYIRRVLSLI